MCFATFNCMVWSKFGINYGPAFLSGGVSKRSHCAVGGKKHSKYLEYMHRCIHTHTYIHIHTCRERKRDAMNEAKRKNLVSWREDRTEK